MSAINHVVILMQENRSLDNYLGALPYMPAGAWQPDPALAAERPLSIWCYGLGASRGARGQAAALC